MENIKKEDFRDYIRYSNRCNFDWHKEYNGEEKMSIPDYKILLDNYYLSSYEFNKDMSKFIEEKSKFGLETLNNSIEDLDDNRNNKIEEIKSLYENLVDKMKDLASNDMMKTYFMKAKKVNELENDFQNILKSLNYDKLNKFEEIDGEYQHGVGDFIFGEEIYNLTYKMLIKYGLYKSYGYDSDVRYRVQYYIKTSKDKISYSPLGRKEFKHVSKDFKFDEDLPKEEAKKKAEEEVLSYIEGRKKHFKKKLFSEVQPPLPEEYIELAEKHSVVVGGYETDEELNI